MNKGKRGNAPAVPKGVPRPPGQGTSKAARQRRRMRESMARTSPAIPRPRPRARRLNIIAKDFVHCVIDPFNHAGPLTGVPDRFTGQSIVVEERGFLDHTFTDSDSKLYIWAVPQVGGLWHYSCSSAIASMSSKQEKWSGSLTTIGNMWENLEQFRTISLAVKIVYTGSSALSGGTITIARVPVVVTNESSVKMKFVSKVTGMTDSSGAELVGTDSDGIDVVYQLQDFSLDVSSLLSQPDSVSMPLRHGAYALSTRNGSDSWNFVPLAAGKESGVPTASFKDVTYSQSTQVVSSDTLFAVSASGDYKQGDQFPRPDSQWNSLVVYMDSIVKGSAYFGAPAVRVEYRHCFEATVSMSVAASPYRTLARSSPNHDPAALETVAQMQRSIPAAIPAMNSWWDRIVKGAGRAIGNFALGAISPVADVVSGMYRLGIGGQNYPALGY